MGSQVFLTGSSVEFSGLEVVGVKYHVVDVVLGSVADAAVNVAGDFVGSAKFDRSRVGVKVRSGHLSLFISITKVIL